MERKNILVNQKNSKNLTVAILLSCSCLYMPWYAQAQDSTSHKDDIIHGDDIGDDKNHKENHWEVRVPNAKGEKQSFAIFDVYDKTNDPEGYEEEETELDANGNEIKDSKGETKTRKVHKEYRDFQTGEKEAFTDSLIYLSDMLGVAQKDNLPLIELKLKSDEDANAQAGSSTAIYKDNEGKLTSYITGTELAETIQAKEKLNLSPEEGYHAGVEIDNAEKGQSWYFDTFPILPENGTQSDYYGTVTHEMFHALGLSASVKNDGTSENPNIHVGTLVNVKEGASDYAVFNKYEIGLRDVFGRVGYYYFDANEKDSDEKIKYADDNPLGPDDGTTLPAGVSLRSRDIVSITLEQYNKLKNTREQLDPNKFYVLRDENTSAPDSGDDSANDAEENNVDKLKNMQAVSVTAEGHVGTQGGAYFTGKNVKEVLTTDGEVAAIAPADGVHNVAVVGGVPVNGYEYAEDNRPELSHIELQNSLMSHQNYRNWCTFMEAELVVLQDLGYDIDRSKYFGKSIYNSGAPEDYFGYRNTTGFNSAQRHGIGLHVYGSYVDVEQAADINAAGSYSMGIRVDGVGNKVNINSIVRANGEGGNALAVTYGKEHDVTLQKDASLIAMGKDGVAARFDFGSNELSDMAGYRGSYIKAHYVSELEAGFTGKKAGWNMDDDMPEAINGALVESFDVNGTLAGQKAAIYISPNALVKNINIMDGASITGDIISKWNPDEIIYQNEQKNGTAAESGDEEQSTVLAPKLPEGEDGMTTLRFGVQADENGQALQANNAYVANKQFQMNYTGNIISPASINMDVIGGTLSFNGQAKVNRVLIADGATLKGNAEYTVTKTENVGGDKNSSSEAQYGFINHGTIAPGNSIGTMRIDGDFYTDGTIDAEVMGDGTSDKIIVDGQAVLDSKNKIQLTPVQSYFNGDTKIQIVENKTGDDSNVTNKMTNDNITIKSVSPTLKMTAQWDGAGIVLHTSRDADAYSQCAENTVSRNVALALDKSAGSVQGEAQDIIGAIDFAGSRQDISAAMYQLNPSIYNSSAQAALNVHNLLNNLDYFGSFSAYEPSVSHAADAGNGRNAWRSIVMPFYSYTDQHDGLRGYTNHDSGVLGAMERTLDSGWTVGYHVAVNHQSTSDNGGSVKGEGFYAGTQASYAPAAWNGWSVFGSASVGIEQMRSHRNVYIGSYSSAADAKWTGYSGSLRLGTALTKETHTVKSGPFAAVQYSFVHRPGITEDGGAIRAHIDSETYDSLRTQLGYQLTTLPRIIHHSRTEWQAYISAAWNHELLSNNGTTTYQLLDFAGISIRDTAELYGRDSVSLMAGVTFRTPKKMDISLNIGSDMYRQGGSSIYGKIGLKWKV